MKKALLVSYILVQLLSSCQQGKKETHDPESEYPFKWKKKEIEKYYSSIYLAGKLSGFTEEMANSYAACKTADAIKRVHDPTPYVKTQLLGNDTAILDVKIPDDPNQPDNCLQDILK